MSKVEITPEMNLFGYKMPRIVYDEDAPCTYITKADDVCMMENITMFGYAALFIIASASLLAHFGVI